MDTALALLARYEAELYGLLGALALASLVFFWAAQRRLDQTPFGLEKDAARRRQNAALAAFVVIIAAGLAVFAFNRYALPAAGPAGVAGTPAPDATPLPSPTPIQSGGPLVVDSSGCQNPAVTLTQPASGEKISGAYEIRGTANIPNFAFYKVEMSGAATSGAWVTLAVGNVPQVNSPLGSFDTAPYQSGEYAFRLVVTDNVGRAAPPCVIVVSLLGGVTPSAP